MRAPVFVGSICSMLMFVHCGAAIAESTRFEESAQEIKGLALDRAIEIISARKCGHNEIGVYLGMDGTDVHLNYIGYRTEGLERSFIKEKGGVIPAGTLVKVGCLVWSDSLEVYYGDLVIGYETKNRSGELAGSLKVARRTLNSLKAVTVYVERSGFIRERVKLSDIELWPPTDDAEINIKSDPRFRFASFLKKEVGELGFLAKLASMRRGYGQAVFNENSLNHALMRSLIAYGYVDRAIEVYGDLCGNLRQDDVFVMLDFASLLLTNGDIERAACIFNDIEEIMPDIADSLYIGQKARMLLIKENYEAALQVFLKRGYTWDLNPFDRYNLGIALYKHGRRNEGLEVIERIALGEGKGRVDEVLRDRARLFVGKHFLRKQAGATAKYYLERISEHSPYFYYAQTMNGWAELIPAGDWWKRTLLNEVLHDYSIGDVRLPRRVRESLNIFPYRGVGQIDESYGDHYLYYRRAEVAEGERTSIERALDVWRGIVNEASDVWRPEVVEAWLLVARYLKYSGDERGAIEEYIMLKSAIEDYEDELQMFRAQIDREGCFVREVEDQYDLIGNMKSSVKELGWVLSYILEGGLAESIDSYTKIYDLKYQLERLGSGEVDMNLFHKEWGEALVRERELLCSNFNDYLADIEQDIRRYKSQVFFELARLYDTRR